MDRATRSWVLLNDFISGSEVVVALVPGGAAEAAGVKVGQAVVRINEQDMSVRASEWRLATENGHEMVIKRPRTAMT